VRPAVPMCSALGTVGALGFCSGRLVQTSELLDHTAFPGGVTQAGTNALRAWVDDDPPADLGVHQSLPAQHLYRLLDAADGHTVFL
jgi:hypothetical protein